MIDYLKDLLGFNKEKERLVQLSELEKEFERRSFRIKTVFGNSEDRNLLPVYFKFPHKFLRLSDDFGIGDIQWRDFYCNDGVLSCHNRWQKGAMMRSHAHPNADEYIYVINGELVRHLPDGEVDRVLPVEQVESSKFLMRDDSVNSWYKIPAGEPHILEATEPNTNFVAKYIQKVDNE